jgi:hypothetical protein
MCSPAEGIVTTHRICVSGDRDIRFSVCDMMAEEESTQESHPFVTQKKYPFELL